MKIGQYCQLQRCKHVELEQFWHAFASRGFVSDSWAFLLKHGVIVVSRRRAWPRKAQYSPIIFWALSQSQTDRQHGNTHRCCCQLYNATR